MICFCILLSLSREFCSVRLLISKEQEHFFACHVFSLSSSLYKAPWTRLMVYGLGHKVRRNGQLNLMEAVCYPLDASPSNTGLTPPPTANQYPSIIIPTDKVHVKLGMSNTLRCYIHFWISPTQKILLSMFNIYKNVFTWLKLYTIVSKVPT